MRDLIERQDAIDAVESDITYAIVFDVNTGESKELFKEGNDALKKAVERLKDLPSAQPEVIRCTECKHYRDYDSEYVENAVVVQCMADRYPISETIPDGWFCAGAERKDDE